MARIGLKNFKYGLLSENSDGTYSYSEGKKLAKAISCSVSISNNSATLYADDVLAESDTGFQSGTITLGIDNEDMAVMAELLGHTVTDNEMVMNSNDTAPYVGLGRIVTLIVSNVRKYKVNFIHKIKFAEPSNEENTKGESLEFGTSSIEGTFSTLADGKWGSTKTFDTEAEAQAYLDSFFTTPTTQYTVTYDANGGTGTVASVTVDDGESITLSDGTGLTAPTGKVFDNWDTDSTAATGSLSGSYTVTADVTLYAIWVDE